MCRRAAATTRNADWTARAASSRAERRQCQYSGHDGIRSSSCDPLRDPLEGFERRKGLASLRQLGIHAFDDGDRGREQARGDFALGSAARRGCLSRHADAP